MNKNVFWISPIVVMAVGVLPLPYVYYSLLRCVVCICALFFVFKATKANVSKMLVWLFGGISLLYNPILPIQLNEKSIWMIVNLITAIIFIFNRGVVNEGE